MISELFSTKYQLNPRLYLSTLIYVTSFVLFSTVAYAQTFGVKQRIFTGPSPYGIKAVDVNKDGNQDLIWLSSLHNIEVRLGEGNGRFAMSGPIYDTKLSSATEFEVADMNHDGHPDIVVAGDRSIAVLRGNGDGTFRAPLLFSIATTDTDEGINSLSLGDFNKDGKVDAMVSVSTAIEIAFGKGDGTFQSPAKVIANGLTGQHSGLPGQISASGEAGDLDHDGNLDVALYTCCDTSDDSLLFGGTLWAWYGDGKGNFPTRKAIQTDLAPVNLKVFDINQDSKADILAVWQGCHDTCVFGVLSWLYAGSRSFTGTGAFIHDGGTHAIRTGVTFGDFDQDGILDLATGTDDGFPAGLFVFRRHADGSIEDPQFRNFGNTSEADPSEIISADFNNDGKNDLALTFQFDNTILVMPNTTTPPGACSSGLIHTVHVCTPANNSTVSSPVSVSARAESDRTVTSWKIYVDGVAKSSGSGSNVAASLVLGSSSAARRIQVKAWDAAGQSYSSTVSVTVH